jgi:hypothetical protein
MNGTVQSKAIPDFQSADLTWHKTDESKGSALLAYYLQQSDQKNVEQRNRVRTYTSNLCYDKEIDTNDYISVDEIKVALKRSKNSATGPDGIRYEDINKLSDGELNELIDRGATINF